MSWARHVVRMWEMRNAYKILVGDHSEDLGVGWRVVLKILQLRG
jgi:hypothetical protein